MAREEQIFEVVTYDGGMLSGYNNQLAKVGVEVSKLGIAVNLPGDVDFGPSIFVERRPDGWSIAISPADNTPLLVKLSDNGRLTATNEQGDQVFDHYEPTYCDECDAVITDESGNLVNTDHRENCSLHPKNVVGIA